VVEYYNSEELSKRKNQLKVELKGVNAWKGFEPGFDKFILNQNTSRKCLDFGCGNGSFGEYLHKTGYRDITLVDFDNYTTIQKRSHITFKKVDLNNSKLPFKDDTFDLITGFEVLEHLQNPWLIVDELYRILKKDGLLILSFPTSKDLFSRINFLFTGNVFNYTLENNHISFFTIDIFRKLFGRFSIVCEYYSRMCFPILRFFLLPRWKMFSRKTLYVFEKKD
jgi:2-polyprenyl-3-methyl-5-hydroxy-6-metoxy-1,4-benzoquinol methylase